MEFIAKSPENKSIIYFCKDKVNLKIMEKLELARKNHFDEVYFGLARLLQGEEIYVTFSTPENIIGRTNETQLLHIWSRMDKETKKEHFNSNEKDESDLFEKILNTFGDGKTGFFIDVQTDKADIMKLNKAFNTALVEQENRRLANSKNKIEEMPQDWI